MQSGKSGAVQRSKTQSIDDVIGGSSPVEGGFDRDVDRLDWFCMDPFGNKQVGRATGSVEERGVWKEYWSDEDNVPYYFNMVTKETTWTIPRETESPDSPKLEVLCQAWICLSTAWTRSPVLLFPFKLLRMLRVSARTI